MARFCDNNATELFDLFLECMPEYNIDKVDSEGNTPLLLAYIKVMLHYLYNQAKLIIVRALVISAEHW